MRTTLKAFIYEDLNRYVPMCRGFLIVNLSLRFPPYVRYVETSLDALQTTVIDGSTPEVKCTYTQTLFLY
jgi:hypothetical protein